MKTPYEITPLDGLCSLLGDSIDVQWVQGYSTEPGPEDALKKEAIEAARSADAVILFGGLNHDFDREGTDRPDMKLPYSQDILISELLSVRPDAVIVLISGSPVEMHSWIDKCSALLWTSYGGMEGGTALAEVLFGSVNPSGKLPVTMPCRLEDSPAHAVGEYPGTDTVHYHEGILVGYRYFSTKGIEPLFPFGHGLSYTEFYYSPLDLSWKAGAGGIRLFISFSLANTGYRPGMEVVQVYIRSPGSHTVRPERELKSFTKVFLNPGASSSIVLGISKDDLRYYNEEQKQWIFESGEFEVLVGSSSFDIRQTAYTKYPFDE